MKLTSIRDLESARAFHVLDSLVSHLYTCLKEKDKTIK